MDVGNAEDGIAADRRGMAPRRSHKKSRHGCLTCRRRRVKCDEQGPPCANCTARQIGCSYPPSRQNTPYAKDDSANTRQSQPELPVQPSPASSASALQASVDSGSSNSHSTQPRNRELELELMHNYSTKAYSTLMSYGHHDEIWQQLTPHEAFKHDFLLDGVLAFSAFHMASEQPERCQKLVNVALEYQNLASGSFREALNQVTEANTVAIFIFSILMMVCAIASPRFGPRGLSASESPTETLFLLFDFLQGVGSIVMISRPWLMASPMKAIMDDMYRPDERLDRDNPEKAALDRLRARNGHVTGPEVEEQHRMFASAIDALEACFTRGKVTAISWLGMAGEGMIIRLKNREPMAQLIFVHWGILLHELRDRWWARDFGSSLVHSLSTELRRVGPHWVDATAWARSEVGLEPFPDEAKGRRTKSDWMDTAVIPG